MKRIFFCKERMFPTRYIMDELREPDESQYIVELGDAVPDFSHLPQQERREIARNMLQIDALQRMERT